MSGGRRTKFYYAAQTGIRPPRFAIVTNNTEDLHFSYKRRVVNTLREIFGFYGVPIEVDYRARKRKERSY